MRPLAWTPPSAQADGQPQALQARFPIASPLSSRLCPRTPALTGCAFFGGLALVISSRLYKFYAIIGFGLLAMGAPFLDWPLKMNERSVKG